MLRIATLNIWHNRGPWPDRLALIRRELARLEPAVIALQEVLRHRSVGPTGAPASPETCQAMEIAHGLGYEVAYGAASDHDEAGVLLGNAVLSRMPIRRERVFPLPGRQSGESRSMLFTLIETPYGDLPVFVTHLNWELHHGSVRLEQVRFIVARVSELAPADGRTLPALLLGDFNAEPDSDEMRFLRGLSAIDGQSVYFADAWIYGGDGSAGATFDRANDYARLAHEPSRRIDYIYLQGPDEFLRGEPVRTQLAFTTREPASGIWPSDHFGVVSDVVLARRES